MITQEHLLAEMQATAQRKAARRTQLAMVLIVLGSAVLMVGLVAAALQFWPLWFVYGGALVLAAGLFGVDVG